MEKSRARQSRAEVNKVEMNEKEMYSVKSRDSRRVKDPTAKQNRINNTTTNKQRGEYVEDKRAEGNIGKKNEHGGTKEIRVKQKMRG